MKKSMIAIFVSLGVVIVGLALYFVFFYKSADPRTEGLTKVPDYNNEATCEALSPACGLCYGEVIDSDCYVDKTKLTPDELGLMGL